MTFTWLSLNPVLPSALLIVLLLAATVVVVVLEARRKHRFRTLRVIAAAVLMLMVAAILLRPRYNHERSASILLLTPDFTTTVADSLVRSNHAITILRTPGTKAYRNAPAIASWQELAGRGADIQYIVGQGIPQHAFDILGPATYTYLPAPAPKGIVQLTLPINTVANRTASIHGTFNQAVTGTMLVLTGPGGGEDSVRLTKTTENFILRVSPKQPGNNIYTLTARDSSGYHSSQSIPLTVQAQKPYNILFLQRYPTFETQYLKRFLARQHALVMRYQVSQKAYRYEYANHAAQNADRLTGDLLRTFDLVVIDTDVLHTLPASETQTLQQAITQGLGVLVLFNDLPANINHLKTVLPIAFKNVTTDTARVTPLAGKTISLPALPVRATPDVTVMPVTTAKGSILAGYRHQGMGKAGFQLLQETYRLTLEGDSVTYSNLWSPLLEHIAREASHKSEIHCATPFPYYTNAPISINVITTADALPTLTADSVALPLAEDLTVDNLYHTTTWAATTGWHTLAIPADSVQHNFFVSPATEWTSLAAVHATRTTHAYASTAGVSAQVQTEYIPIPPLLFYSLLLLAAGFLWLAPKL